MLCFGEFELDLEGCELRRRGKAIRLERRPMDLLMLLAEKQGQLVSRDEIVKRLWGPDVFVDIEAAVNTAIRKVRHALRDSPRSPAFVETVPGRGYRFIAEIERRSQDRSLPDLSGHTARLMLAVLPFENLSSDPGQDYFSDGLTEETISYLGRINPERIGVIARTTSMAYKKTRSSIRRIGEELGVDYVLESSVRGEGNSLRITSQLIRVADQTHVWAYSFDRELTRILEMQRELSIEIARQVQLQLDPGRLIALAQQQTQDAEAYDLYLRGRYFWNQLSPPTTKRAIEFYRRATQIDPNYALAWSGLTDAYAARPMNSDAPPLEVWPLVRDAATRAIAAAPDLAETQTSMGFLKFWLDWDWNAAEAAFRRAIALNRSYALAHRMLGIILSHRGAGEESLLAAKKAREIDPLNAAHQALSAQVAFAARDFQLATDFSQQAIAVDPEFWIGHMQLGQAYEQLGRPEQALQALNEAARFSGGNSKPIALRGYILANTGRLAEAEDIRNALEAAARERYVPPYAFALVNAGLGRIDRALDCLERAFDARDPHLVFLTIDPKWDSFRRDSRFVAILDRCAFRG